MLLIWYWQEFMSSEDIMLIWIKFCSDNMAPTNVFCLISMCQSLWNGFQNELYVHYTWCKHLRVNMNRVMIILVLWGRITKALLINFSVRGNIDFAKEQVLSLVMSPIHICQVSQQLLSNMNVSFNRWLDIAQILAYPVHNMSRSQLYLGFGHFGWLPSFFSQ